MLTDTPLARFTTMTIPKKPKAMIEKSNSKDYVYIPKDSPLSIMISNPGSMPRIKVFTALEIEALTSIDVSTL